MAIIFSVKFFLYFLIRAYFKFAFVSRKLLIFYLSWAFASLFDSYGY